MIAGFAIKHLFIFMGFCVFVCFQWSVLGAVAEEVFKSSSATNYT